MVEKHSNTFREDNKLTCHKHKREFTFRGQMHADGWCAQPSDMLRRPRFNLNLKLLSKPGRFGFYLNLERLLNHKKLQSKLTASMRSVEGCEALSKTDLARHYFKNQNHKIKFWKCLHALNLTLNAMRPIPRLHSINFMKILRFSQN